MYLNMYAWFDESEAFWKSHDIRLSDKVFNWRIGAPFAKHHILKARSALIGIVEEIFK